MYYPRADRPRREVDAWLFKFCLGNFGSASNFSGIVQRHCEFGTERTSHAPIALSGAFAEGRARMRC
jgi:hypothetical protein